MTSLRDHQAPPEHGGPAWHRWDIPPWERRHLAEHWRAAGLCLGAIAVLDALLRHTNANTLIADIGVRRLAAELGASPGTVAHHLATAEAKGLIVTIRAGRGQRARRQFLDPADAPMTACRICEEARARHAAAERAEHLADLEPWHLGPESCESARSGRALSQEKRAMGRARSDGYPDLEGVDGSGSPWAGVDADGYAIPANPEPRTKDRKRA